MFSKVAGQRSCMAKLLISVFAYHTARSPTGRCEGAAPRTCALVPADQTSDKHSKHERYCQPRVLCIRNEPQRDRSQLLHVRSLYVPEPDGSGTQCQQTAYPATWLSTRMRRHLSAVSGLAVPFFKHAASNVFQLHSERKP